MFFHATLAELRAGDLVTIGFPAHYQDTPEDHVYFTDSETRAERWAGDLAELTSRAAIVYCVEPAGPYDSDPYTADLWVDDGADFRTQAPLRIVSLAPGY